MLAQLREHETDAVPRDRVLGLFAEHLSVRLERARELLAAAQQQRKVETRLRHPGPRLERGAERGQRLFTLARVMAAQPGETISLTVQRDGDEIEVDVTLDAKVG